MALQKIEEGAKGFFAEFWAFAAKGNAIQLAVAVVLGGAFGAIVNSLVTDIITPFLSLATNNVNFSAWGYTLRAAVTNPDGTITPAVAVNYGHLLQATINFFVVGLSIFLIFKLFSGVIARLQKKEELEEQAAPPVPVSTQEKLLGEIRDLLKEQSTRTIQ
ncbi:large conductance mechanosensitive channel protein MscL [Candidatus Kaiserbacteria bacterium]|nr:large conductance mechanosensitive channel protein MscL [Candidatus Kaiserbacteria bacterium]